MTCVCAWTFQLVDEFAHAKNVSRSFTTHVGRTYCCKHLPHAATDVDSPTYTKRLPHGPPIPPATVNATNKISLTMGTTEMQAGHLLQLLIE